MDPRLRLQAELKDNASPGIRKIGKELREVKKTPGMEQAEKWFGGLNEAANGFGKSGANVSSILSSIGVGGLTASLSVAGLVEQFKKLADSSFQMKRLGQETGLTVTQVARWQNVGQQFHIPVESMQGALKTLGDQMVDFKRRRGELFEQLNQFAPELAKKLGTEGTADQLKDILGYLGQFKNVADRNRWAKEFFGTDDLAALLTNGFPALQKAMEDANKNVPPITEEMQKQADIFNNSLTAFQQGWTNFEQHVGPTVFAQLSQTMDKFKGVFDDLKTTWDWLQKAKADPAGSVGSAVQGYLEGQEAQTQADKKAGKDKSLIDVPGAILRLEKGNPEPGFVPDPDRSNRWKQLRHKSSFDGDGPNGGFLIKSAFVTGMDGSGGTGGSALSEGVKSGVLAAFREWAQESQLNKPNDGADGAGGLMKTALETWNSSGGGGGGPSDLSGGDAAGEHADYIRGLAKRLGIDPRVAVAVAKSEGLDNPVGDHGTSFGDYQLHYGGGLGDIFTKQTGLDARDPKNWKSADEWALKYAQRNGWSPWHGAARIGVSGMMGLGGSAGSGDAVGVAEGLLGANSSRAQATLRSRMTPGEWCADFVNGVIKGAGGRGVNSSMASAFATWGQAVGLNDAKRGDVILERHGNHIGHVGLATGRVNANGDIEMISGNYGGTVRKNWEHRAEIAGLRRGMPDLADEAAKAAADRVASQNGSIEAHVHLHEGRVRGVRTKSSGIVAPPTVHLNRAPGMTTPNSEA